MAKEKAEKVDERMYTIPLRREWQVVPAKKRANRTVRGIRSFVTKHTKAEDVKVSSRLNQLVWKHGIKNPPASVKVKVSIKEGVATARLPEEIVIEKKKEAKKPAPKNKIEELKQKAEGMKSKKEEGKEAAAKQEGKESMKDRIKGFVKEIEDGPEEESKGSQTKKNEGKPADAKQETKAEEKPKKDESNSKQ